MTSCPTSNEFDWEDYLTLCVSLQSKGYLKSENLEDATVRNVISRAYYSAFMGTTKHLLNTKNSANNPLHQIQYNGSSHKALTDRLHDLSKSETIYKFIGDKISNLKINRIKADYNTESIARKPKYNPQLKLYAGMANVSIIDAQLVFKLIKDIESGIVNPQKLQNKKK